MLSNHFLKDAIRNAAATFFDEVSPLCIGLYRFYQYPTITRSEYRR